MVILPKVMRKVLLSSRDAVDEPFQRVMYPRETKNPLSTRLKCIQYYSMKKNDIYMPIKGFVPISPHFGP